MLKVIRDGLAPIGEMLLGYVAGTEPLMDFSTMPFLVANADQAGQLGVIARPVVERVFDKWNQKMLYWQFWPGAGLYSQKPINSLEDLKGLKIRTFNAVSTAWVKAAGGNPVSLPWGDVYMAMSTGAIDALITSTTSGADGKFWEVMKYFTRLNFTFGYSAVTVNKKSFAGLDDKQKQALLETAKEMEKIQLERSLESRQEGLRQAGGARHQGLGNVSPVPKRLRRPVQPHLGRVGQEGGSRRGGDTQKSRNPKVGPASRPEAAADSSFSARREDHEEIIPNHRPGRQCGRDVLCGVHPAHDRPDTPGNRG